MDDVPPRQSPKTRRVYMDGPDPPSSGGLTGSIVRGGDIPVIRASNDCLAKLPCTFPQYGKRMIFGPFYKCLELGCATERGSAMCVACMHRCHAGHRVLQNTSPTGMYFCGCGAHNGEFTTTCCIVPASRKRKATSEVFTDDDEKHIHLPFSDDDEVASASSPTISIARVLQQRDMRLLKKLLPRDGTSTILSSLNIWSALLLSGDLVSLPAFSKDNHPKELMGFAQHEYVRMAAGVYGILPSLSMSSMNKQWPFSYQHTPLIDADRINNFVAKSTENRITEIVSDRDLANTRLVVVSAIYFKGPWRDGFDPAKTQSMACRGLHGARARLMMRRTKTASFFCTKNLDSLVLPYRDTRFWAVFTRLRDGIDGCDPVRLAQYFCESNGLRNEYQAHHLEPLFRTVTYESHTDIWLPRFKVQSTFNDLATTLLEEADMNAKLASTLQLQNVRHKAMIEVDEQGAVAAAATTMLCLLGGPRFPTRSWHGNVPFLVAIRDAQCPSPLFLGYVDLSGPDTYQ